MTGKTLGHYRVGEQLGRGGMGEVYLADDLNLNRKVALKFLPDAFTGDPERMARFEREAKLLASLNHPNIAAIHGLEQAEGKRFLVLELVEGETLAQRLGKGRLPVEEALGICRQIAEGLEAAHEKGVIHRDLKPANVMITEGDKVKILDFGLAKALSDETQSVDSSQSPTLTEAMTRPGVILGTAAYMAPEQARGSAVDKRCDIWSFGVVLFEMLTGKQLFSGETVSDTLAAVLRSDIDWNSLPANTPAGIRALLRRCLNKDRKERLRDIGEARIAISQYLANPSGASVHETVAVADRHKHLERLAWVSAVVLLIATLSILRIVYFRKISEPRQVTRFEYTLPEDQQFSSILGEPLLAVSPDGRQFAYNTNKGLFVRSLDKWDAQRIVEANENPSNPFFSPDGQWVGYRSVVENKLKKVSVKGGGPIALCDVGTFSGAFWGADDTIICGEYGKATMMRVSANGGNPEVLFKGDATYYYHPQLLPDGKSLLFTLSPYPYRIATRSLGSREGKILISSGDRAFYLPTRHLVYGLKNYLYAVPFDTAKLAPVGASVGVVEGVFRPEAGSAPQYDVSPSGTLIYVPITKGDVSDKQTLVWVNRDGKEELITAAPPNAYTNPRISPDGRKVAVAFASGPGFDIWILDLIRKNMTRLTLDEADDRLPLWTIPDGKRIAFTSTREGSYKLYWKSADGVGKDEPLTAGLQGNIFPWSWAGGGKTLVAMEHSGPQTSFDIGELSMEGSREWKQILKEKYNEGQPKISPDGQWMAYTSDESGAREVYLRPFPDVTRARIKVSTDGGHSPLWSPDGRELFYRNAGAVMAVSLKTKPAVDLEAPRVLFRGTYIETDFPNASDFNTWDIHPDGKRFLMIKPPASTGAAPTATGPRKINIVLNWFEELKQQVPVK
jgi:serine/threonine protein kinase/Tol biopolymer transport system component